MIEQGYSLLLTARELLNVPRREVGELDKLEQLSTRDLECSLAGELQAQTGVVTHAHPR